MLKLLKKPILFLALCFSLMALSLQFGVQLDLTLDKRYSLSENSIKQLQQLKEPIRIDLFLDGELPGLYRELRNELDVFLIQLEHYSDKLIVQYNDPFEIGSTEQVIQEMQRYGMNPEIVVENKDGQRSESIVFPWMIINYGEASERVPLLQKQLGDTESDKIARSLQQMEYLIMDGIYKVSLKEKSNIAVLTSHKTSDQIKIADLLQSLKSYYNLGSFDLKNPGVSSEQSLKNLNRFDVLLVSNPNESFSSSEKYILDQYALQGGGILWLVNGIGIDRDSLFNSAGKAYGFPLELNLDDYFFHQGIRINKELVQDLYCAPIVLAAGEQNNTQYVPYPWPFYPLPTPESTLIGQDIGPVLTQFISPIDLIDNNLKKISLLQSSKFTKSSGVPTLVSFEQATQKIKPSRYNESSKNLGVLIEGEQSSLYTNRVKPFKLAEHLPKGSIKMVVFGDGNLAENQIDKGTPLQLGYDKWTNNFYNNKSLLLNAFHYLSSNPERLMIRQKQWDFAFLDPQKIETRGFLWKIMMLFIPVLISLIFGWLSQRGRSKQIV
ncbi:gliding motility-associated ABC transporter substrate-binding protein GldG [Flavobacteriaceae bacterium]|nr:gliding motility-associated ABC transporter substrate-binding protein GldG [Flavobacteriaceae bacterium]